MKTPRPGVQKIACYGWNSHTQSELWIVVLDGCTVYGPTKFSALRNAVRHHRAMLVEQVRMRFLT